MIYVEDNFLPQTDFLQLMDYCEHNDFQIVGTPGKRFSVLELPDWMHERLHIEGYEKVFSFIRNAYKGFDNDWRIHADNIIQGRRIELASVLYINNPVGVSKNGTAFWSHWKYGMKLPENVSEEEFDRMIISDSNDLNQWEQTAFISSMPNRLVTYDANYFHSKYPNEINQGVRIVLASFYSKINA